MATKSFRLEISLQNFIQKILNEIFIQNILFDKEFLYHKFDFIPSQESQSDADVILYKNVDGQNRKKI